LLLLLLPSPPIFRSRQVHARHVVSRFDGARRRHRGIDTTAHRREDLHCLTTFRERLMPARPAVRALSTTGPMTDTSFSTSACVEDRKSTRLNSSLVI